MIGANGWWGTHALVGAAATAPPIVCPKPSLAIAGFSTSFLAPLLPTGVLPLLICSPLAFRSAASRSRTALASSSSLCLSYPNRLIRSSSSIALRCASSKLILVAAFFAPSLLALGPPAGREVVAAGRAVG